MQQSLTSMIAVCVSSIAIGAAQHSPITIAASLQRQQKQESRNSHPISVTTANITDCSSVQHSLTIDLQPAPSVRAHLKHRNSTALKLCCCLQRHDANEFTHCQQCRSLGCQLSSDAGSRWNGKPCMHANTHSLYAMTGHLCDAAVINHIRFDYCCCHHHFCYI